MFTMRLPQFIRGSKAVILAVRVTHTFTVGICFIKGEGYGRSRGSILCIEQFARASTASQANYSSEYEADLH